VSDDLERCPFCGLNVEVPCDAPPPIICQTAHAHLLIQQGEREQFQKAMHDSDLLGAPEQFLLGAWAGWCAARGVK
jgi:hypothetical protein